MRYVVAVSGGVDSVVLLDMLHAARQHELIVAHFDHGIRPESDADARFVANLAGRYGLPFVTERAELGKSASEETARAHRYAFLRRVAREHDARIATAHHDDVVETVAINLLRGTGWRGLAVLNDRTVDRPLLGRDKSDLYGYAMGHGLEWTEDETNRTDAYLRNRLRRRLSKLGDEARSRLLELHEEQRRLATVIDDESARLATPSRYFMTMVDESVADELLRAALVSGAVSLTRPQRRRLLLAIKTARPGQVSQPGAGVEVGFTMREFIVKHPL